MYFLKEKKDKRGIRKLFSIIWENVSEDTQDLLMSRAEFNKANTDKDPNRMVKNFHSIVEDFDDKKHIILSLDDMLEKIVRIRQGNLPVKGFIRTFRQEYNTYKEHGCSFLDGEAALEIVEKR